MAKTKISLDRRMFLTRAAPVVGLTALGVSALAPAKERADYAPSFFTPVEWAFLVAAVDRLIPVDENGPGAVEAGVCEFIDRQMEMPYGHGAYFYMQGPFQTDLSPALGYQLPFTPRELYRRGIADADAFARKSRSVAFAHLRLEEQDAFLHLLEAGKTEGGGAPPAAFFAQLLENVREGYLADPMYGGNRGMGAWKMIGFPGARADFTDWIDQQGKHYPFGPVSINGARA